MRWCEEKGDGVRKEVVLHEIVGTACDAGERATVGTGFGVECSW